MAGARWFVRLVAVIVGLANLFVLGCFGGGEPALPAGLSWGTATPEEVTATVLAAVGAGLATSEVAIRRFDRLSAFGRYVFFERFSYWRAGIVAAVCLGGAIMGGLFGALLVLQGPLMNSLATLTPLKHGVVTLLRTTIAGGIGAFLGAVVGAIEGLLLAPTLAAVLARIDRTPPRRSGA